MKTLLAFCLVLLANAVALGATLKVGIVDVCSSTSLVSCGAAYVNALRLAGHIPVVLPAAEKPADIAKMLDLVDLVLFAGGEDVEPARYGEAKKPTCERINFVRDAFEWKVLDEAKRRRLPVFGICRGEQLINCYFGGTLYQDIPTEVEGFGKHRWSPGEKRAHVSHDIEPVAGSRLAAVIGGARCSVKAWHHQSVKALAPAFRVSARMTDGVVEAIEGDGYPAAGVQFHPEQNILADPNSPLLEIFRRLDYLCGIR